MPAPSPQLANAFFAALPGSLRPYCTNDPAKLLRIPAKAAEVGDLVVYNDGDEFTVEIGKVYHRHFECSPSSTGAEPERPHEAAQRAIKWIEEVLVDRIRFRVQYSCGQLVAGSSWNPAVADGGQWLTRTHQAREYLWSGEQPANQPAM